MSLSNGATISASTFGEGNAGTINIDASDTISIDGEDPGDAQTAGGIFSNVQGDAVGDAGGVEITTTNLNLTNAGRVDANTFAQGNAGTVTIKATDTISIDGQDQEGFNSGISSSVNLGAVGNAGGVNLTTKNLSLSNGAVINASTSGEGDAGSVSINADESIILDGTTPNGQFSSGIFNTVEIEGTGQGGSVDLTTANLSITNGAAINVGTFGEGNGGNVAINASESITLDGTTPDGEFSSGIGSEVDQEATGDGGSIEVTTPNLLISNGAGIFADTEGDGDGGNITLSISDRLELKENSTISVQASETDANAGNITINADDGFVIAFPNEAEGNGSDISASSGSVGGNIFIEAQGVLGIEERDAIPGNNSNDIDASGAINDGSVEISTPATDAIEGANQLPNIPVEPGETVVQACSAQRGIANSNLVIKGKGGIPNSPAAILTSEAISVSSEAESSTSPNQEEIQPISTSNGDIILAQGVEIKEDGGIILTAHKTDNSSRNQKISVNCN